MLEGPEAWFQDVGFRQEWEQPTAEGVTVISDATTLEPTLLEQNTTVLINIWICDKYDNCQMTYSFPILINEEPIPHPGVGVDDLAVAGRRLSESAAVSEYYTVPPILADCKVNTTINGINQYLVDVWRLAPCWNVTADLQVPLVDSLGMIVWSTYALYVLQYDAVLTPVVSTRPSSGTKGKLLESVGPGTYPYGVAQLHGNTLELGRTYMLVVTLYNRFGTVNTIRSRPLVADWTGPVCSTPKMQPTGGLPIVRGLVPGITQPSGSVRACWAAS